MLKEKYLERLEINSQNLENNEATLNLLVAKHYEEISFENIDLVVGRQCTLDIEKLCQKILIDGRGGTCLELNALFMRFLQELGFQARLLLCDIFFARDWTFGHCIIIVKMDNNDDGCVVDVGNALPQGPVQSLPLQDGLVHNCSNGKFKTLMKGDMWNVLNFSPNAGSSNFMRWHKSSHHSWQQVEELLQKLQHPVESHVPNMLKEIQISRKLENGRKCLSLRKGRFNVHHLNSDGIQSKELVEDVRRIERYKTLLKEIFNINEEKFSEIESSALAKQF